MTRTAEHVLLIKFGFHELENHIRHGLRRIRGFDRIVRNITRTFESQVAYRSTFVS